MCGKLTGRPTAHRLRLPTYGSVGAISHCSWQCFPAEWLARLSPPPYLPHQVKLILQYLSTSLRIDEDLSLSYTRFKMTKLIILLSLIIFIGLVGWFFFLKGGNVKKVNKEGPVIFLGDSLTVGVGANRGEDFPSLIANELGLNNVINAGVSGDTSKDALGRLQIDVLDKNPSLVIVLLGGNDFLRQIPIEETVKNIDEIVRRITETNSAVVLVHIKSNPLNDKYGEPAEEIAHKYGARFVPNVLDDVLGNPKLMSDQVHPNSEGYNIIASRIAPEIKKVLQ